MRSPACALIVLGACAPAAPVAVVPIVIGSASAPAPAALPSASASASSPVPARFHPRMAFGDGYGCVRRESTLTCEGSYFFPVPGAPLVTLDHVRDFGAGEHHACAILEDRTITCWGGNEGGQLGDGTIVPRWDPRVVADVPPAVEVAVGHRTMCALFADDSVRCWGGITGTKTPKVVSFGGKVTSLGVSFLDACAILDDTSVRCLDRKGVAHAIEGMRDVVALAIGAHGVALKRDGTVWSWSNVNATPKRIAVDHVVQVSGPAYAACARRADGRIACWQTGDSTARLVDDLRDVDEIAVTYMGAVCGLARGEKKCVDTPRVDGSDAQP